MKYLFSQTAVTIYFINVTNPINVNSEILLLHILDFFSLKSFVRQDAAIRYRKQDNSLVVFSLETGPGGARQFLVGSPGSLNHVHKENCRVANPNQCPSLSQEISYRTLILSYLPSNTFFS
jgi:hypothetical protein